MKLQNKAPAPAGPRPEHATRPGAGPVPPRARATPAPPSRGRRCPDCHRGRCACTTAARRPGARRRARRPRRWRSGCHTAAFFSNDCASCLLRNPREPTSGLSPRGALFPPLRMLSKRILRSFRTPGAARAPTRTSLHPAARVASRACLPPEPTTRAYHSRPAGCLAVRARQRPCERESLTPRTPPAPQPIT